MRAVDGQRDNGLGRKSACLRLPADSSGPKPGISAETSGGGPREATGHLLTGAPRKELVLTGRLGLHAKSLSLHPFCDVRRNDLLTHGKNNYHLKK